MTDYELFDKFFPFYLSCGMTYDQYWNDDPWLTKAYYKAQKLRNERRNQEMWLQGAYIYNAFSSVMANAFSKKGAKPHGYLDKPIPIYPPTKEEREAEKERERQKAIRSFQAMIDAQQRLKNQ